MSTASPFGRLLTAMVSPMHPDGSLDLDGARRLAEHLVDTGHDGIVVNGTTGESATLSEDESIEMVRLVADTVGDRAKVVAGVGSNATAHSVAMTRRAADAGATGLLLVTPYYNKPTQAGVVAHCRAVAEVTDLPVMLYDIPGRTAIPFTTETLRELATVPSIVAVKDAKGDPWASTKVMAATDLLYFSGDDATTLPWLSLGAVGTVSVVGHVAGREYAAMIEAVDRGDLAAARDIHRRLVPAVDAIMSTSQGAIMAKAALVELGIIEHPTVRLPLLESPPEHLDILRTGLKESGLL
ncbi:4-hydroxy-tetrahydrodipicolinate synthase [Phycicoccus sp. Soil748]|uniref:4-hydroxy-tetrahydrodipicolinate synthase n=1 Tax=Phycicoccus sp. Soil748 TaxID=1736397 RepID=UPI00070285E6|nr:4-hydroxy-tetrahydrodipicolinate synthase [Phycicoccus sp. Soil748]KRE53923.1 4-hydroxy-tetrahydrodipicolinate synthase [Phycicoccus sp. Soil748]